MLLPKKSFSLFSLVIASILAACLLWLNISGHVGHVPVVYQDKTISNLPTGIMYGWPLWIGKYRRVYFDRPYESENTWERRHYIVGKELKGEMKPFMLVANVLICAGAVFGATILMEHLRLRRTACSRVRAQQ